MAHVRIAGLTKSYGVNAIALRDINLSVERGELVALIGPSGSGKSTLLRHIAGLVAGDRRNPLGIIEVGGRQIQARGKLAGEVRRLRTRIGFVFQQFNLVNRLTVLTNVRAGALGRMPFWRAVSGWFTAEETALALESLQRVGIVDQAYKHAGDLSGGQQQRAAIARALMQQAEVILADEPIASLDPESSRRVMETLARINAEDGITVLVSLHQVDFAVRYCRRVIALRHGEVVYDGPATGLTQDVLRQVYGSAGDPGFDSAIPSPDVTPQAPDRLEPLLETPAA